MKKTRQRRALLGYFVLVYLVVVVAFTIYRYHDERIKLENIVQSRLLNGAAMIKYIMPDNYFDRAVDHYSISQNDFNKYTVNLSRAAWENHFSNLFALKEAQGKYYYIACSLTRKDISEKKFCAYWEEFPEHYPELEKAFNNHKTVFSRLSGNKGTFYAIFMPEYSSSGQYYIAGADYDSAYLKKSLDSIITSSVLQALILLVLLFFIYVTLSRLQKHYIRKLQYSNSVNESAPIGVMSLQPDGRIDYVNPVFAILVGLSIERLDGSNIHSDLGFNKNDELINRIRICLLRQISWQGEFLNTSLSGKEYWVNANINYIQSVQEGKAMVNVYAADVTTQMKSRISLGQHNRVLNYLSQAIHNLLANPDISKTLPEVLSQYGQNMNKSQVSVLKNNLHSYEVFSNWIISSALDTSIPLNMFSQVSKPVYTDWENSLMHGQVVSGETYDFPISLITVARIHNPGILHVCPIFCDEKYWGFIISLQTQREDAMDEELEQTLLLSLADSIGSAVKRSEIDLALRHSVDIKTRFMSSMSHEIRTPLNGVIGMINLLESTELTSEQKDFIEAMKVSGRLLMNLINNILDITRIEAGKTLLRSDPVALASCIKSAVNIVNYELKEKHLSLELTFDPELPNVIQGDETRLKQVIVNLLHNAIKFTDKGGIMVNVDRKGKSRIQFTITDTGIGMSEEQLKHIFEPFFQTGPLNQRMKGTGLGLAISKQIIEMMNGDIYIESSPNKGTKVYFTIEQPILDDVSEYVEQEIVSNKIVTEEETPVLSALQTVFLPGGDLDDKILQNYLFSKGYNHETTDNWKGFYSRLHQEDIKLAIVNISDSDPERDELVKDIKKAHQEMSDKYWLILTTKSAGEFIDPDNPTDKIRCLPKPLDFDQTLMFLKSIFGSKDQKTDAATSEMQLEKH